MEELNHEESIKLANSKEHLLVIRGNIKTANEELAVLLKQNDDVYNEILSNKKNIKYLEDKIEKKKELLNDLNSRTINKKIELDSMIQDIEDLKNEYINQKNILNSNIKEITSEIVALNDRYSYISDSILSLEEHYGNLSDSINELEEYLANKSNDNNDIKNQINLGRIERDKVKSEIESCKSSLDKLKKETEEEVEKNKEAIKGPLNLLARREREIKLMENDANILIARLRKVFNEMYPDRTFTL